jgi:predicted nucleic acid-binding protein
VIVLDASAAVELLGGTPTGKNVAGRLQGERLLHAPHLIDLEVLSALRRQAALDSIGEERTAQGLALFQNLRILRYPHYPYLERIWEHRNHFTVYDACYLALTESLNATLLTCDSALRSARLSRGEVEVL